MEIYFCIDNFIFKVPIADRSATPEKQARGLPRIDFKMHDGIYTRFFVKRCTTAILGWYLIHYITRNYTKATRFT